jgi:hypothetical protein
MAYKHYTSCFPYPSGRKPYNEDDRTAFVITQLLLALTAAGVFTLTGLIFGPIGAVIGGILGSLAGFTNLIANAADEWLNHRLICLNKDNPQCAVGIVSYDPTRSDLGAFDNDQYFDVILMPHPAVIDANVEADFDPVIAKVNKTALALGNRYKADGAVVDDFAQNVSEHPANDILNDDFQGQDCLSTRSDIAVDLGYALPSSHERSALHCEAEGDFWVRIKKLAPALAAVIVAALAVTAAGAEAGSELGRAVGCAIASWFFGPIGCAIGGFFGGLLGGAAGAAAAGAASYYGAIKPILQTIFEASPGDVQDANVGDKDLGPIRMGDKVAVMGEHVYDGYHKGWNEFHPLMAIVKIGGSSRVGLDFYLEWQPDFRGIPPGPPPGETILLKEDDMREGLSSTNFKNRCKNLKRTWCSMLTDAFSEPTRQTQQGLHERWTIHPMVDGCRPADPPPPLH